jgi:hypothetical protein
MTMSVIFQILIYIGLTEVPYAITETSLTLATSDIIVYKHWPLLSTIWDIPESAYCFCGWYGDFVYDLCWDTWIQKLFWKTPLIVNMESPNVEIPQLQASMIQYIV